MLRLRSFAASGVCVALAEGSNVGTACLKVVVLFVYGLTQTADARRPLELAGEERIAARIAPDMVLAVGGSGS